MWPSGLVLPSLTPEELGAFGFGRHTLDAYARRLIHRDLAYQFRTVSSGAEAMALEAECRRGSIFGQVPLLNPLQSAAPGSSRTQRR